MFAKSQHFVPDGISISQALQRTTHLGIGAHPDDLEILAFHGISDCYKSETKHFTGAILCDGAGSPRSGRFQNLSDAEMVSTRQEEQFQAARVGDYSAQVMFRYSSEEIKNMKLKTPTEDVFTLLKTAQPECVYVHSPFDKHDTHVAVCTRTIKAIARLADELRPKQVWACEVWRDHDWLPDSHKVPLGVSQNPKLAKDLLECFQSQIAGGKRYDLGTLGRRSAHAVFSEAHATDNETAVIFAIDLIPLINSRENIETWAKTIMGEFQSDVLSRLERMRP